MSRRITLDAVMSTGRTVAFPRRRVESSIPAGLRMEWLSGEGPDGLEFHMSAGAACGSPFLTVVWQRGDDRREEVVDMRELLADWLDAIDADGPTPKVRP